MSEVGVRDRLRWLGRSMVSWVLAVVLLVVALAVGVSWSLGLFTASGANPRNVVSSGSMRQVNSADNAAIMGAVDVVPGDTVEGSVSIRNAGDARGDFALTVEDLEDRPGPGGGVLSSRLRLEVVEDGSGEPVYAGPLDGLDADLGTWEPEEERTYGFVVRLPNGNPGSDDVFQGSSVTVTFEWNAVQSP